MNWPTLPFILSTSNSLTVLKMVEHINYVHVAGINVLVSLVTTAIPTLLILVQKELTLKAYRILSFI